MEFLKSIRLKIGNTLLDKKLEKTRRKVLYTNMDCVRKIGIVWDASQFQEFGCLSKFNQRMNERNIEVSILGYFPGKNLPDQYTAIRYLSCIRKDEINLFYHPVSAESGTFINNRFDILIDINFRTLLPLRYLTSMSNAAFKIGLYEGDNGETPFDLMMDIKKPVDVDHYLNQIMLYLEMIDAGKSKTTTNQLVK